MISITDLAMQVKLAGASTLTSIAVFSTHDKAFYRVSEDQQRRLKLPCIAFHQAAPTVDMESFNYKSMEEGSPHALSLDEAELTIKREIPITLPYEINIYALKLQDLRQVTKDIVFSIFREPVLSVIYGTGETDIYEAEIMRTNNWDNSGSPVFSLGEMWTVGKYYHQRLNVDVKTYLIQDEVVTSFMTLNVRFFDGLYSGDENLINEYEISLVE